MDNTLEEKISVEDTFYRRLMPDNKPRTSTDIRYDGGKRLLNMFAGETKWFKSWFGLETKSKGYTKQEINEMLLENSIAKDNEEADVFVNYLIEGVDRESKSIGFNAALHSYIAKDEIIRYFVHKG